jgi:hypothetical protein
MAGLLCFGFFLIFFISAGGYQALRTLLPKPSSKDMFLTSEKRGNINIHIELADSERLSHLRNSYGNTVIPSSAGISREHSEFGSVRDVKDVSDILIKK